MPWRCKGLCTRIAKIQDSEKKKLYVDRKNVGRRPRELPIASISKRCTTCNEVFYLVDYNNCKCCGSKFRNRTYNKSLSDIAEEAERAILPLG